MGMCLSVAATAYLTDSLHRLECDWQPADPMPAFLIHTEPPTLAAESEQYQSTRNMIDLEAKLAAPDSDEFGFLLLPKASLQRHTQPPTLSFAFQQHRQAVQTIGRPSSLASSSELRVRHHYYQLHGQGSSFAMSETPRLFLISWQPLQNTQDSTI